MKGSSVQSIAVLDGIQEEAEQSLTESLNFLIDNRDFDNAEFVVKFQQKLALIVAESDVKTSSSTGISPGLLHQLSFDIASADGSRLLELH